MDKGEEKLNTLLDELGIEYKTTRHRALFKVEDASAEERNLDGAHCKSLFLKDKKGHFLLVVMMGYKKLNMKALSDVAALKIGRLSFATTDNLYQMLRLIPGAVTPFGLINLAANSQINFTLVLDKEMMEHDMLNYHPLHNEATTSLSAVSFLKFLAHLGHDPLVINFEEL